MSKVETSQPGQSTVPHWWRFVMVMAAALYLVPEAIFNAQLVNVSGQGVIDPASLHKVEIFGRMISGVGVSLLILDAISGRFVRGVFSGVFTAGVIFALCWPTVFYGQKWLIDHLIINPSTAQERQHANLSQTVRGALASNAIVVEGIDYNPNHTLNPQEMTFLALFGGMVYADNLLAEEFEKQGVDVMRSMVKKDVYAKFGDYWGRYETLYDRLSSEYEQYAGASHEFNQVLATIPDRQKAVWEDVDDQLDTGYEEYRQGVVRHIKSARDRAEQYGPKIYDAYERHSRCKSDTCRQRVINRYNREIEKLGLGPVPFRYWAVKKEVSTSENVLNTIVSGVLTGGGSLVAQGMDALSGGDGGFRDYEYSYTQNTTHYQRKIQELDKFEQEFIRRTGYPSDLSSFSAFRNHRNTANKVRDALREKGFNISDTWRLEQTSVVNRQVKEQVETQAREQWQAQAREHGFDIAPNIPWKQFQVLPVVQAEIEGAMGIYYVKPTYVDWNQKTFKEKVVDRAIDREARSLVDAVLAQQDSYADGGGNAEKGKQALRSIVVPPISMGISLFLVMLTLVKLPAKILGLFAKPSGSGETRWLSLAFTMVAVLAIAIGPLYFWQSSYTTEGSTVHYFLDKTEEVGGKPVRHFLNWILHAQPIMHPAGDALEGTFGIYASSDPLIEEIERLDEELRALIN